MTRPTQPSVESLSAAMTTQFAEQRETNANLRSTIESSVEKLEEKFTATIDAKFTELIELMSRSTRSTDEPTMIANPITQPYVTQVPNYNLEPGRSFRVENNRTIAPLMDDRDSLIQKVELPIFSGDDVYGWIALAERFFRIGGYNELMKIDLVSVSLGGDVLSWFNSEVLSRPFLCWNDFKERLIARFSRVKLRDPSQPFFNVHQTGSVAEYIHKFEDLSTQVYEISDKQKEGIFMNGLTPEMQEVVIATAYQMETSSLLSVVKKEMQQRNKANPSNTQDTSKSYSSYTTNGGWKQKQTVQATASNQPKQSGTARPALRLSDGQLADKKRLGLCFQCDAKWSRQHAAVCPNAVLRVLTVVNGVEMEVITQEAGEGEEDDIVWEPQLRTISVSSLLGLYSPTTTKLRGTIKNQSMVVMVDSEATHSFISPSMVKQLKLKADNQSLEIMLGTGTSVPGVGVCRDVIITLQGLPFQS